MSQTTLSQLEFLAFETLTEAIDEMADLEVIAARAEAEHKRLRAKAFLSAQGSMAFRESVADADTADALLNRRLAEAKVRVQRERIRALHTRIDVGRTIASTERRIVEVAP